MRREREARETVTSYLSWGEVREVGGGGKLLVLLVSWKLTETLRDAEVFLRLLLQQPCWCDVVP